MVDPTPVPLSELVTRARDLATSGSRVVLGITGPPGAGKSTVARHLVDQLGPELAVLVPMDGFHLANATLIAWDRRDRKGAWDTFDADGYVHLLRRLRAADEAIVHAPTFDRDLEESIGSAIPVRQAVPLVVTEGNYLLATEGSWGHVAPLLNACWYLQLDDRTRVERLVRRRVGHGSDLAEATAWAKGSDQANAEIVLATRDRASLVAVVDPGR